MTTTTSSGALSIVLTLVVAGVIIVGIVLITRGVFTIVGRVFNHLSRFIGGMVTDTLRFVGAIITAGFFVVLAMGSIVLGRWSASKHYFDRIHDETRAASVSAYRVVVGHPARLFFLTPLVEGIEQRLPAALAEAPGADNPSPRTGQFDGYTIVGSLPSGGSGSKLYIADPTPQKLAAFARAGLSDRLGSGQVVIKSFSLKDGSTMPQIVRESRALEAARKLGLVLDHELNDERFYYAMPYVPGDSLAVVTRRLHTQSPPDGLGPEQLKLAISYIADLLTALEFYHRGGLWHKDVKPDNIIISAGRAHVVDLGLITPLRSGMTLTTHGTEYYRDPELVRMALRGAKVHEVDGVKFDVYGAGAVLYSIIENSFPAHGGLSQINRKCPEALRWIIRRAMAEMHQRYPTAEAMLVDLRAVAAAPDPFALKPIDLPSMNGVNASTMPPPIPGTPSPFTPPPIEPVAGRFAAATPANPGARAARVHDRRVRTNRSAEEQLKSARERVAAAQARVGSRRGRRYDNKPNAGAALLVGTTLVVGGGIVVGLMSLQTRKVASSSVHIQGPSVIASTSTPQQKLDLQYFTPERLAHGQSPDQYTAIASFDPVKVSVSAESSSASNAAQPATPKAAVLLVSYLPVEGESENRQKLAWLDQRLRNAGYRTYGLGSSETDIELLGAAKNAIGLTDPSSTEAVNAVSRWLGTRPSSSPDAVILIPRGDGKWTTLRHPAFQDAGMRKLLSDAITTSTSTPDSATAR